MKAPDVHGVLVVHKPVGPSSHDVVVIARRSLGIARVGHTGTLDPHASGVLPLVVGQATRLAQHLTASDKEYDATVRFGVITDTYDAAGTVVQQSDAVPARAALEAALARFRGTFDQAPPAYSAKMVGGERSYARARAGKPPLSPAAAVTVHQLQLLAYEPPLARVLVRCSSGFYVRSLAHDLGQAVETGAVLHRLVRTESAGFRLDNAVRFETLVKGGRAELRAAVRPMETLLMELPSVWLTVEGVEWSRHGRRLGPAQITSTQWGRAPQVRLIGPDGRLVGLADGALAPGSLQPIVIFSYN